MEVTAALCGLGSTLHYLHLQTSRAVALCSANNVSTQFKVVIVLRATEQFLKVEIISQLCVHG